MNDYKAGDRVEYTGANKIVRTATMIGATGVIKYLTGHESVIVAWDDSTLPSHGVVPENLRHVTPAPDVITIDRSELPEVVADGDTLECGSSTYGRANAVYFRSSAMKYLAIAEFLDARERQAAEDAAAEKLAIARRDKRRDELCQLLCSELIDLIIDLESEK